MSRAAPVHLIEQLAASHPKLRRGRVWCTVCGHSQAADSAHALQHGWPTHCGVTMTIDSPEERGASVWPWRKIESYNQNASEAADDLISGVFHAMVWCPTDDKGTPEYLGPARLWWRGTPNERWLGPGRLEIPRPTLWAPISAFRPRGADGR